MYIQFVKKNPVKIHEVSLRQRLSIARAVILKPRILVLDEARWHRWQGEPGLLTCLGYFDVHPRLRSWIRSHIYSWDWHLLSLNWSGCTFTHNYIEVSNWGTIYGNLWTNYMFCYLLILLNHQNHVCRSTGFRVWCDLSINLLLTMPFRTNWKGTLVVLAGHHVGKGNALKIRGLYTCLLLGSRPTRV